MNREAWFIAAEAGDQVVLVGLDCSFGGAGAMEVRGGKLEIDALLMHQSLQASGAFIFQNLEERAQTAVT